MAAIISNQECGTDTETDKQKNGTEYQTQKQIHKNQPTTQVCPIYQVIFDKGKKKEQP